VRYRGFIVTILFVALFVLGEVHEQVPKNKTVKLPFFHGYPDYPKWDGSLTWNQLAYDICEHGKTIILVFLFWYVLEWEVIRRFAMIEVMDLVDFILCYNYVWENPWHYNFEFNMVKIYLGLGFSIHYLWTKRHAGYSGSLSPL
jgi:hypothetical protein